MATGFPSSQRLQFYVVGLSRVILTAGWWVACIVMLTSGIEFLGLYSNLIDDPTFTIGEKLKVSLFLWSFIGAILVVASVLAKHWFLQEYCEQYGISMHEIDQWTVKELRQIWLEAL